MLKSLLLKDFRNHKNIQLELDPHLTIIIGQNAAGKTNVIEAVYLLATGESFRAGKIEEMVGWEAEVGHVIGEIVPSGWSLVLGKERGTGDQGLITNLRVTVTRGMVQGRKAMKRGFVINGVNRRKSELLGLLPTVLFRPEDMDLISGNPSGRRRFLNEVLVQVDREYARSLMSYEKALQRRNKLLDLIRDGEAQRSTLLFWDQLLIKEGNLITDRRERLIEVINNVPSLLGKLELQYDRSTISVERLEQYAREEVAVGYTLVGPHKDDFKIISNEVTTRDMGIYGSRGEQRMAVLWLKEAQLTFMEKHLGERPLLLLDDIMSELDEVHETKVIEMARAQQTVVTTTSDETVQLFGEGVKVIRIE